MAQGGAAEQEVRQEDQQRINTFNKLNSRLHELQAGVKAKKVLESHGSVVSCNHNFCLRLTRSQGPAPNCADLQSELEDLEDAGNELMLLDDDQVELLMSPVS